MNALRRRIFPKRSAICIDCRARLFFVVSPNFLLCVNVSYMWDLCRIYKRFEDYYMQSNLRMRFFIVYVDFMTNLCQVYGEFMSNLWQIYVEYMTTLWIRKPYDESMSNIWRSYEYESRMTNLCLIYDDCTNRFSINKRAQIRGIFFLAVLACTSLSQIKILCRFYGDFMTIIWRFTDHYV